MAHGDHLKYQAKPKAGRQTLFRLTSYLVCDRLLLSVIGVLIVLSIAANLGGSYLLRPIINRYIIPGDFLGLGKMLGILIGVYLTGVFAVYVEYRLLNKIGQRTVARMREDLFRKMEQLPVGYFDTHQHGDLMSRYTNDMDRISDALTDSLSDMLSSALTVVGIFCLMLVISPILTLVTLVTVPLMFWSARGIVRKSRQYFKAQQASLGSINGYIEEMISGQKVVKVFGHEQKAISDFEELNQDLKGKSLKAQFYSGLMMPVMQNLSTLNYVLITIVGALLAIFRGFDVGGLAAFLQYSRQFGRPWIFKEVKHYLETGEELPPLSFKWRMDVLRQEVLDSVNLLDERRGILHVRRHLAASPLFKGIPNFKDTRIAMLRAETLQELNAILDHIENTFGKEE